MILLHGKIGIKFLCSKKRQRKKQPTERLLFSGEGIFCFLWGVTKNYIMYWGGVTSIIVAQHMKKVFTNIGKYLQSFYAYCENDIMYFVKNDHE